MKIKKEIISFEEVEITFPAYYKMDGGYYLKIISENDIESVNIGKTYAKHDDECWPAELLNAINIGIPISEQEWKDTLNKYRERVEDFLKRHGVPSELILT